MKYHILINLTKYKSVKSFEVSNITISDDENNILQKLDLIP